MKLIICENEVNQREFLHSVISHYATVYEPSIEVVLAASKPEDVVTYLHDHRADCYFLDIELDSPLNGMDLARIIREHDPFATIIFISMHADRLKLTFKYKLAALDFIVKDDCQDNLSVQVIDALKASFIKYKQLGISDGKQFIQIKIGERLKNISYDDIYYFETSPQVHKIELHEINGHYEFYGKLKELEKLNERFYRCHKSYIINLQHVLSIDKDKRTVTMANNTVCYISFRGVKELLSKMTNFYSTEEILG